MKLIGLIDTSMNDSSHYLLLEFIREEYSDLCDLEIVEVTPNSVTAEPAQQLSRKIALADGIILAIDGQSDQILSILQQSGKNKAVLTMSTDDYNSEAAASQLELRQILESPDIGAYTFPGNEFFLGNLINALNGEGQINKKEIIESLRNSFVKYLRFVELIDELEIIQIEKEDLYATGSIETTIDGLDKEADEWLEQAAVKVNAVDGDTYVKLDRGILTVNQLDYFLNSMPLELTFMDANNQFLYYNYHMPAEEMLASTQPTQVGSPIAKLHPAGGHERVEMLIQQLRSDKMDSFPIHVPTHEPNKFVVHNYKAVKDESGNYLGVNEYVLDLQPIVDWYLKQTNQEFIGGLEVDAVSSASTTDDEEVDGVSSASTQY